MYNPLFNHACRQLSEESILIYNDSLAKGKSLYDRKMWAITDEKASCLQKAI